MYEIFQNINFRIKVFRHETLNSNWQTNKFSISNTIIPFARLYYPLEGEGNIVYDGQKHHLVPGKIYLVPPFANAEVSCPHYLIKYWGHFNAYILDSTLDIFTILKPCYEMDVKDPEMFLKLFRRLAKIYYCSNNGNVANVNSLQELEGNNILALLLMPFFNSIGVKKENPSTPITPFIKLLAYIEENLAHGLSLPQLAEVACLNPTYLSNSFAAKMGIPLIQYCNGRRIKRAIDLIWSTNYSISEIVYKVGANNADSFSRLFKRHTGYTPAQYKKLLRNTENKFP